MHLAAYSRAEPSDGRLHGDHYALVGQWRLMVGNAFPETSGTGRYSDLRDGGRSMDPLTPDESAQREAPKVELPSLLVDVNRQCRHLPHFRKFVQWGSWCGRGLSSGQGNSRRGCTSHVLLFFCLVQLPLLYASMRYLNDEKMHFWRDLLPCLRTGLRHWGFIFITVLLSSIFVAIIIMLLMIPYYILSFARFASEVGVVTGDPSGMPGYFPWLQLFTAVIVFFLVYQVTIFEALVIYFMYGSIETQEKERQSAKTIPPISDIKEEAVLQPYPSSI